MKFLPLRVHGSKVYLSSSPAMLSCAWTVARGLIRSWNGGEAMWEACSRTLALSVHLGDSVGQEETEILAVHRDHLRALARECYEVTAILVHIMLDRARVFTSSALHDEKMVSLGKLSAGLAHGLNNPASAIERSAALLPVRLNESEEASRALALFGLTNVQWAALDAARESCASRRTVGVPSAIERADREEAMAEWLADHGLDTDTADALAETD